MKERPILFNDEMVRAILAGEKTQTRRPVKGLSISCVSIVAERAILRGKSGALFSGEKNLHEFLACPYGNPGDVLRVGEAFAEAKDWRGNDLIAYRADYPKTIIGDDGRLGIEDGAWLCWEDPAGMPEKYSRISIEIVDVWVERLQDIDSDGVVSEGISAVADIKVRECLRDGRFTHAFAGYWEGTYGRSGGWRRWHRNPFVWVISFRRIKP